MTTTTLAAFKALRISISSSPGLSRWSLHHTERAPYCASMSGAMGIAKMPCFEDF
jgi:hypothetical protein